MLLAFTYYKNIYDESKISRLVGTCNDIKMMTIFCKQKGILPENITILTDLSELPKECSDCNNKFSKYPESDFVCRGLAQFVENTVRGIENDSDKSNEEMPQVLIYLSGHGSKLKVTDPEERNEQGFVLLDNDGIDVSYLTTKDIFNILFGRLNISSEGILEIPIYTKKVILTPVIKEGSKSYKEETITNVKIMNICISPITKSHLNSPGMTTKPTRSTYNANRGIPPWTQVLCVIDTCHSAHMTHFPYIYSPRTQNMDSFYLENVFVQHSDLPFCVSISSCGMDKKTKSAHEGSHLTSVFFRQLIDVNEPLNLSQFHYYMTNSKSSLKSYVLNKTLTPVLSSTSNNSDVQVPFFSSERIVKPRRIIKKSF